jgi:uncharacterized membrane protein
MAQWNLSRNCALTPRQALLAWSLPAGLLLAVAAAGAALAWWWVTVFALATLGGLATALWHYCRHALDGDTLVLGDDGLLRIEQRDGHRRQRCSWRASLVRMEAPDGGPITLWAGREKLQVGLQVPPTRRRAAARELQRLLRGC